MTPSNPNSSSSPSINPENGYCSKTKTFYSLRPPSRLPDNNSCSLTNYIFSLLRNNSSPTSSSSLIDATSRHVIPYSEIPVLVSNLSLSLLQPPFSLCKGTTAFILSPNSSYLPILYLSLLHIGVIVSPSNPACSIGELSHQIKISRPAVAFVTAETRHKLSSFGIPRVIDIDSNDFKSIIMTKNSNKLKYERNILEYYNVIQSRVLQSDTAAILYSSGTTGKVKGVKLSHMNLISTIAGAISGKQNRENPAVYLCAVPYFHMYGFGLCFRMIAFGDSLVSISRFDLGVMVRCVEEFRVTHLAVAPPVVVALVDERNERLVSGVSWKSLECVVSGGAPVTVSVIDKFKKRFPNVPLIQAYGLTETTGGISRVAGAYESTIVGTVGRLIGNCEAKIVDPETGVGLPPMNHGELWVRGPFIMKGYVNNKEVIDTMVDANGWLRTGDLCYFDNEGFLFVVDRLKELIKYKGYQVPPAELEHILHSHPDIVEAAVIPYPDEVAGQVPMGFIVRRKRSTINETQVKDFVAKQVAPYKKLRRVCFVDSIPKNAPGKVLRKDLIKLALSGVSSKL
uniref:4-coumarate--CoA ligase-like 9 isoform X2 n=1 Tax=Erigeron canadensis TaxID=72917 RepID=UPI001CB8F385|nr:4-coumarate--CoA ligase-like 9 isoform X2 [Erigeron canadensis]